MDYATWILFIHILSLVASKTIQFYVSPAGSDTNNGSSSSSPFETLQYTQNKVRSLNVNKDTQFIINLINDGPFYLNKSLDFSPSDSGGSGTNNIIYQSYDKSSPSTISGGFPVPSTCFKQISSKGNYNIYECDVSSFKSRLGKPNDFRTLRIGNKRATPCRYPKLSPTQNPYTEGWLTVKSSEYKGDNSFLIGVLSSDLSNTLKVTDPFKVGNIHIFPQRSWVNIEINVQPATGSDKDYTYFKTICPPNHECTTSSNDGNITPGNRFYFYNISQDIIPIQEENEWYFNTTTNMLYIAATADNVKNVVIPNTDYIIRFLGETKGMVENIVFDNIIFMDADYSQYGFQSGFNTEPYKGVPEDGAIRISESQNITIKYCEFLQLGGGGITISNKSQDILISNNIFIHIGQSGIALVGDNASQAKLVTIENNTIEYVGDILASAGGIYASSVSDTIMKFNNISWSSRWGIAIRSNGGGAMSYKNYIGWNRINITGTKTMDFGGISLIGEGYTGTLIINNCARNCIGVDTDSNGHIETPYASKGIYLDNYSSGFYIFGNVMDTSLLTGALIHGGLSNYISNNIFFNSSTNQVELKPMSSSEPPKNNTILRNVYYYYAKDSYLIRSTNNNWETSWAPQIDYNLYYNPNIKIGNISMTDFTPAGPTWNDWINGYNKRYDQHSLIDTDPMFKNVDNGNFEIDPSSPLITKLNFKPIPSYIAQC